MFSQLNLTTESEVRAMGYRIAQIRKEKGLTQDELSNKSGVSRTVISFLETGKVQVTTTATLIKLSKALGCSVNDIFFDEIV